MGASNKVRSFALKWLDFLIETLNMPLLVSPQDSSSPSCQSPALVPVPRKSGSTTNIYSLASFPKQNHSYNLDTLQGTPLQLGVSCLKEFQSSIGSSKVPSTWLPIFERTLEGKQWNLTIKINYLLFKRKNFLLKFPLNFTGT